MPKKINIKTKFSTVDNTRFRQLYDQNPAPTDDEISNIAKQLNCDKKAVKVRKCQTSK
jgi:ribosomal protein S24E